MTSKIIKDVVWAGMLAGVLSASGLVPSAGAQQSATEALQKARVLERMAEGTRIPFSEQLTSRKTTNHGYRRD